MAAAAKKRYTHPFPHAPRATTGSDQGERHPTTEKH